MVLVPPGTRVVSVLVFLERLHTKIYWALAIFILYMLYHLYAPQIITETFFLYEFCSCHRNLFPVAGIYLPILFWLRRDPRAL